MVIITIFRYLFQFEIIHGKIDHAAIHRLVRQYKGRLPANIISMVYYIYCYRNLVIKSSNYLKNKVLLPQVHVKVTSADFWLSCLITFTLSIIGFYSNCLLPQVVLE
jgi:hypothetical protein